MARRPEPLFLARETYRRRRFIDAMRLLPVLGVVLFVVPLLGAGGGRSTALGGLYVFAVWLGLIGGAALLTRRLARGPDGVGADPLEPAPGLAPPPAPLIPPAREPRGG